MNIIENVTDAPFAVVETEDEAGFTLVEVMVVVLIIGILLSIGIPTFLGARSRAQDRNIESSLHTAAATMSILRTDNVSYTDEYNDELPKIMFQAEPSVDWVHGKEVGAGGAVSVVLFKDGIFGAMGLSESGACFWIVSDPAGKAASGTWDANRCNAYQVPSAWEKYGSGG